MTQNPLLAAALAYAARGWQIFPCQPRTKEPFPRTHGVKDATTDPAIIESWWAKWPEANIALACGPKSGVYVVDVDVDPEKTPPVDGWKSLEAFPEMPDTVQQATPRGGAHFFFRSATPPRNKNAFRPGIDIRAEGYYVMLAPSIHPNGKAYEWGSAPDQVELADFPDCMRPADAPKAPPWAAKPHAPANPLPRPSGGVVVDRARLYLHECEPAMQGQAGHDKLLWAARALVVGFELDEGTALSLLWDDFNPRCCPPWDRTKAGDVKDFERKVGEVRRTPGSKPRGWLLDDLGLRCGDSAMEAYGQRLAEGLLASLERKIEVPEVTAVEVVPEVVRKAEKQEGDWSDYLLRPPGFVGDLAAWMNETAGCKLPPLSVLASFCAAGVMMGRKVKDCSNGRTNIYGMGVAKTSSGKDHPGKCVGTLFSAAGAEGMLGGGRVTSDSAIEFALVANPIQLFVFDEAGDMYSSIRQAGGGGGSSSYLRTILPALKELWSSANTLYRGKQRANEDVRRIDQPHIGIWSMTTPNRLYEGISTGDLEDGWLARVIAVVTDHRPEYEFTQHRPPPPHLVETVRKWATRVIQAPDGAGDIGGSLGCWQMTVADEAGAMKVLTDFRRECYAEIERGEKGGDASHNLWGKALENARRLALTLACGCEYERPVIEKEHALYSTAYIRKTVAEFQDSIRAGMSDSPMEAEKQKLLKVIAGAGPDGISKSRLTRMTQWLKGRTRNEHLGDMAEGGIIVMGLHPGHPDARSGWLWKAPYGLDIVNRNGKLEDSN